MQFGGLSFHLLSRAFVSRLYMRLRSFSATAKCSRCQTFVVQQHRRFLTAGILCSVSDLEAVAALEKLAADDLEMYEAKVANHDDRDRQDRGDTQG